MKIMVKIISYMTHYLFTELDLDIDNNIQFINNGK